MRNGVAAILLAGGALALLPLLGLPLFYESFLYLVFHWIVLATSWNILSGYSGYFSFGHGAFFGAGMYTTAVLATRYDVPFLWTLPAAALVAALLGMALGAVVFRVKRVRGELFALRHARGHVRRRHDRAQHAHRRRPRYRAVRRRGAEARPLGRRRRSTCSRWRLRSARCSIAFAIYAREARHGTLRHPRRRGRRRGAGRADVPLQARRVRASPARSPASPAGSRRCSSPT